MSTAANNQNKNNDGMCSVLMCVAVTTKLLHLPPKYIARLRNAGSTGFSTYEELVLSHSIPVCLEISSMNKMKGLPVPMHIPLSMYWKGTLPGNILVTLTPPLISIYSTPSSPFLVPHQILRVDDNRIMPNAIYTRFYKLKCARVIYKFSGFWEKIPRDVSSSSPETTSSLSTESLGLHRQRIIRTTTLSRPESWEGMDTSMVHAYTLYSKKLVAGKPLQSLRLQGLQYITYIRPDFMAGCNDITRINLSALTGVTTISSGMLYGCKNLEVLDVSSFSSVTSIGGSFIGSCSKLVSITLPKAMPGVETIESGFLYLNDELKHVYNLAGMTGVKVIRNDFMSECRKLEDGGKALFGYGASAITTSTLGHHPMPFGSGVTSIGSEFMQGCYSLTTVDLSGFNAVRSVGNNFMDGCVSLKELNNADGMASSLEVVGKMFFGGCMKLKSNQLPEKLAMYKV